MQAQRLIARGEAGALFVAAVVLWSAAGAVLGAAGGSVFALLYGAIDTATHLGVWRLVEAVPHFAVAAAAAGAITGAFSRILGGKTSVGPEREEGKPSVVRNIFLTTESPRPTAAPSLGRGQSAGRPTVGQEAKPWEPSRN